MNIADLVSRHHPELRRVGVRFEDRTPVVAAAKKIYLELGIACDLEDNAITVTTVRTAAPWYLGLLERATGIPGFNEWWDN
jgi:hypothetical protein